MLRRDTSAWFEKSGISIFSRYRFVSGSLAAPRSLSRAGFQRLQRRQQEEPLAVLFDADRRRRWWWFRNEFLWEDDGLTADEVRVLALERHEARERRLRRAAALVDKQQQPVAGAARPSIAPAVRSQVWRRDGGRCVSCGSRERLEFDHVIPLALGGSSSARNLQLLCEDCNRAKGASL